MRIDGLALPQLINIKGLKDLLGKIAVGDKLEAQVVEMDGNTLTLRLPNGQNVSATVTEPMNLDLGDFLQLSVKAKNESQVVLQTIVDTNEQTKFKDLGDTLMALRLPPDERNFEIGNALINEHLPLTTENFKEVFNVLGTFEDVNIEKAAFIVANNIQNIPEGKELLDKFENNEVSLGNSINKLVKLMAQNIDDRNLNKIVSGYEDSVVSKTIEDNNKSIHCIVNSYTGSDSDDENLAKLFTRQVITQSNNPSSTIESLMDHSVTEGRLGYLLNPKENAKIFEFISEHSRLEEKLITFLNDKSELNKFIYQYSKENPAVFKNLSSDENGITVEKLRNFFKDVVNNIKDGRIKRDINVNKLYDSLELKMDQIQKHIEKYSITNGDKILHLVNEIKSEVNLIKNIDNMFNFYQLPFNINQNNATVDLYIMKNDKQRKTINPDNATIFLSLNTQNLGQVEVLVHVKDKNVGLNFRLEDEKTIDFFEKRNYMLENMLSEKGYTAGKIKFAISPKRTNIISFEHTVREEKNIVKDVFDVRV